jgi:hypothetical protein
MKRRELLEHLRRHGCGSFARAAIIRFGKIQRTLVVLQFRVIGKSWSILPAGYVGSLLYRTCRTREWRMALSRIT